MIEPVEAAPTPTAGPTVLPVAAAAFRPMLQKQVAAAQELLPTGGTRAADPVEGGGSSSPAARRRRAAVMDLRKLAVEELASRADASPSAAVVASQAVLAKDQASTSEPRGGGQRPASNSPSPAMQSAPRDQAAGTKGPSAPQTSASVSAPSASRPGAPRAVQSPAQTRQESTGPAAQQSIAAARFAAPSTTTGARAVAGAVRPAITASPAGAARLGAAPEARTNTRAGRANTAAAPKFRMLHGEPDPVTAQVGRGLAAALKQSGTVTLRLNPEAMGQMRIRLDIAEGRVTARFEVENDQARELLSSGLHHLRSALEARGLGVDGLHVELAGARTAPPGESAVTDDRGGAENPAGEGRGEENGSERPGDGTGGPRNRSGEGPEPDAAAVRDGTAELLARSAYVFDEGGAQTTSVRLDAVA